MTRVAVWRLVYSTLRKWKGFKACLPQMTALNKVSSDLLTPAKTSEHAHMWQRAETEHFVALIISFSVKQQVGFFLLNHSCIVTFLLFSFVSTNRRCKCKDWVCNTCSRSLYYFLIFWKMLRVRIYLLSFKPFINFKL